MNDKEHVDRVADYYDTHDTSEEMDELVEVEPARNPSVVFSVRLAWADAERLRALAAEHGEQPRTMVRRWIAERVAEEATGGTGDEQARLTQSLLHRIPRLVADAVAEARRSAQAPG